MASSCLLFIVFATSALAANYIIDNHTNCNNVYGNTDSHYVTNLGDYDSVEECQQACIKKDCDSYTYYHDNSEENQKCYGFINNPLWIPYYANQVDIDCGRIIYPCKSDMDCSLNGKCDKQNGQCQCRKGWNGYKCGNLTLLPATKGTGYNYTDDNEHTSSWGGSIQYNKEKNVYDMFVAEMQGMYIFELVHKTSYIMTSDEPKSNIQGIVGLIHGW